MALLSNEEINNIRSKVNIVDVIGSYIPLTQKGKNYFCVCPFHDDHSPSMSISEEKQIYKCFSCGAGGNVFTFISEYENVNFIEAVSIVAKIAGVTIDTNINFNNKDSKNKDLYEIMNLTNKFYQNNLKTPFGKTARDYLTNRGINEDIINEFEIGLSLDDYDSLTKLLTKKNHSIKQLNDLGLTNTNQKNNYDVFNKRIIFPIHDPTGKVIAFSGRIYKTDDTSKYINSKETTIFKKGEVLYNYHNVKEHTRINKQVIVVEGYMDAIRLSSNGVKNVVAIMGTAMTKEQVDLLKKLRVDIILCLDNDEAGTKATITNGELLEKNGAEVFVIKLSGEKDPDEYVKKNGIEAFKNNLDNPMKFFDYKLNYLKQDKNLKNADDLAKYINQVLNSLNNIEDEILKEVTINMLSEEYGVSKEILRKKLTKVIPKKENIVIKQAKKNKYSIAAEKILYFMLNDVKYIRMYSKLLGYFDNPLYRNIANDILYYFKINKDIAIADFITFAQTKQNIKDKIFEIINESDEEEINEKVFEDYVLVIKEETYLNEIAEIKRDLKTETDEFKKIELISRLAELKKEV